MISFLLTCNKLSFDRIYIVIKIQILKGQVFKWRVFTMCYVMGCKFPLIFKKHNKKIIYAKPPLEPFFFQFIAREKSLKLFLFFSYIGWQGIKYEYLILHIRINLQCLNEVSKHIIISYNFHKFIYWEISSV